MPSMVPQQAIDYFGSRGELAQVCAVTETAVGYWVKQGWIPYDKQCQIQVESERAPKKGKKRIVASWHDIPADKRRAA